MGQFHGPRFFVLSYGWVTSLPEEMRGKGYLACAG